MKKLLIAIVGSVIITGCSSPQEEEVVPVELIEELPEENQVLNDLPEYPILNNIIDLQVYLANIETDNEETRVIFFEDKDGNKVYKSVFVKNESYLKVIELEDGEGILYNEVI
ncbi:MULTISPECIES: hypothetical protein [unclassified Psychrobacillus]|uniref:hypothetical protein n=1 Tax=unclassified Psychrobacillus TaxID=2636677 RepID=UPI00146A3C83|nr:MULTISPECIES: hypothetical protein [unclassified Psychrobacillus]MCM3359385.1 hypothetical protein [Psychrobacillus sp. MER TA 171]NME06370.1 hypothetical protein [Psychrobacillus sp. BL-248-WT-3]